MQAYPYYQRDPVLMLERSTLLIATLALLSPFTARGDDPVKFGPNSDKEPMAEEFSVQRGARFLDAVSVNWTRSRKCGTCHTNYAHMMAGPMVEKPASAELVEVRAFFEARAADWDKTAKAAKPVRDGEVVATAAALAFNDAASTGKLHPLTRAALDRMWTVQRPDGGWNGLTATCLRWRMTITTGPLWRRPLSAKPRATTNPPRLPGGVLRRSAATSAHARPQSSPPGALALGLHGNRRADGR